MSLDLKDRLAALSISGRPACSSEILKKLEELQANRNLVEAEFTKELLSLERKYYEKYQPIYAKRREVIASVPSFWATVFANHVELRELLGEQDAEALSFLEDIEIRAVGELGFSVVFLFKPNPFFTNTSLTRTFYLTLDPTVSNEFIFDRSESTGINWNEGKNLCYKMVKKNQKHKASGQVRTIVKKEPAATIFHFFEDVKDGVEAEEAQEKSQFDYEIADIIKSQIVPFAVDWFTGKAAAEFGDSGYDSDEDDEDYSGDDESDDDSGSEPEKSMPVSKKLPPRSAAAQKNPSNEEQCKQQ